MLFKKIYGCAIAGGTTGIINPILGILTGFACSELVEMEGADCEL